MNKSIELYKKYFIDNDFERTGVFRLLRDTFQIKSALYLGSFVHITPAYIFPYCVFVDNDRRVGKFFNDVEIKKLIKKRKEYEEESKFIAFQQNYSMPIEIKENYFDLLISQYAGFVSQAGNKYLREGGILYVNNSHGDATRAFLDSDYQLIGTIDKFNEKWKYNKKYLDKFFIPKKGNNPSVALLESTMRGIGYKKSAVGYVFKYLTKNSS